MHQDFYLQPISVIDTPITINAAATVAMPLTQQLTFVSFDAKPKEYSYSPEQIYYIAAESNYLSVWYEDNGVLKSEIVRITMAALLSQLEGFSYLKRCHKSYVVNTQKVTNVTGNAKGYSLIMEDHNINIPLSRQYNQQVKDFVQGSKVQPA